MHKLLVILFLFITTHSSAQVSVKEITFDRIVIDFGTIPGEGGTLDAVYTFVNHSDNDFIISGINVACGCTKPRSSQDLVKAGDTAKIMVEFNPFGMIGTINKWIRVEGNFTDGLYKELRFTAEIISQSLNMENANSTYYPGQYGYLVLEKHHLNYGNQRQFHVATDTLSMFNDGYKPITITDAKDLPSYLKILNLPITIEPKEKADIYLEINTEGLDTVGPVSGLIKITTTDQYFPQKALTYYIHLEIDFNTWSKREIKKAPRISIPSRTIEMGTMNSGQVREKQIEISNTGMTPLRIYRIETDCSCALLQELEGVIQPGETVTANVRFDSLFKKGTQSKAITIYTNDPDNPVLYLRVRAIVQ